MFAIFKELIGWLLVATGLYLTWTALEFVRYRQVIEAGVMIPAAIMIFRGGIHLIKVSTAARIVARAGIGERKS